MRTLLVSLCLLRAFCYPAPIDNPAGTRKVLVVRPKGCIHNRTEPVGQIEGHTIWSALAHPITAVEDEVSDEVGRMSDIVSPSLKEEAITTLNYAEPIVLNAAADTAGAITSEYDTVRQKIRVAANQTKALVSETAQRAEGFVSGIFQSTKEWFVNLEDEVKEMFHFGMRILEVAVSVAILVVIIWILRKLFMGYRFVKGIAETFELHDRPQNSEIC